MPRFAANLSMMYNEHAFLDRFAAAARDGFEAVEYLFPYEHPAAQIKARLDGASLVQALFNAPPGNWAAGERGIASLPGREDEFRRSIDTALDYARVLGNRKIHVMAGLVAHEASRAAQRDLYLERLGYAARVAAADGIDVLIEPINTRDMPGYLLNRQDDAHAICAEVGAPNLRVQFDCYHCQIVEGDLAVKLARDMAGIGHIQIAGVPERHEPDSGELNYPWLLARIDELGYDGWIGCEYRPRADTSAGLGWIRPWLAARA
ncbi:Putative hydroxypyruvate isomerase [Paraburkholderia unamae]|uniref:2-oxo-tetronate isomerase n=1 Tax=Paraburkholderia unamae TaxID=219649 RepID=UPI000DC2E391|nr:2-oxo-tetronate isomerase [Paraburkholderia unamae]RAR65133.1 hydroxypyruvate isomerase [Paraburkholderia unamae]CAG9244178.1 Putative hydroxypyruvate isomerase [Paraburkholderia unamae]